MIGIDWLKGHNVPNDEKRVLIVAISSYVRAKVKVEDIPARLGMFTLGFDNPRPIYYHGSIVAKLLDNPKSNGFPDDGIITGIEKVPILKEKPKLETKIPSGFCWDPGYGDD